MSDHEFLRELAGIVRELIDQVSYNASADALQSFPVRDRQLEAADRLRKKLEALRAELV
jgi:hypothetical protein